jgi:hypothetical protein
MWTHYMQYKMMDWPDLRSAIQSKHQYVIERPQRASCWSGISMRKYTLNPLDLSALEPQRWARNTDAIAALKKDEAQFNSFIRSSFSEEAHILIRSNPRYITASNNSSSYEASALHKALWSRSSPAVGLAPSKTSSSTNASRCPLCSTLKVQAPSRSMISSWSPSLTPYQLKSSPRTLPAPSPTSSAS